MICCVYINALIIIVMIVIFLILIFPAFCVSVFDIIFTTLFMVKRVFEVKASYVITKTSYNMVYFSI